MCTDTERRAADLARVVCLGDPVMDILANVTYAFLQDIGATAGGCFAISQEDMESLLSQASALGPLTRVAGGSAANVAKALAGLLPRQQYEVSFMGMVGRDDTAAEYRTLLAERLVQPALVQSDAGTPTATCCCLVTPDGQRTMRTSLGAALELQSEQLLPASWWQGAVALHCEGYALYKPAMAEAVLRRAKEHGLQVFLDLASFELIHNCRSTLVRLLQQELVDVVFCNEEEAAAVLHVKELVGETAVLANGHSTPEDKIRFVQDALLQHCQAVVVSRGAKGCLARSRSGDVGISPACMVEVGSHAAVRQATAVKVVDTVGAGDYFTGGFLAAYLQGGSLQQAAVCGCISGTQAVQTQGAMLSKQATLTVQQGIAQVLQQHQQVMLMAV